MDRPFQRPEKVDSYKHFSITIIELRKASCAKLPERKHETGD